MATTNSRFRWYWWIGLLGFLGFIGFLTEYYALCDLFMLFFAFIRKGKRQDERWEKSVDKACKVSLFFLLAVLDITLAVRGSIVYFPLEIFPMLTAILLLGGVSVFVLSYAYFDRRGD
jgi:hypothetical protein